MDKLVVTKTQRPLVGIHPGKYVNFRARCYYSLYYYKGFDDLDDIKRYITNYECESEFVAFHDPIDKTQNPKYEYIMNTWLNKIDAFPINYSAYIIKTRSGVYIKECDFMKNIRSSKDKLLWTEDRKSICITPNVQLITLEHEILISVDTSRPFAVEKSLIFNYETPMKSIIDCLGFNDDCSNKVQRKYTFVFGDANLPYIVKMYFNYKYNPLLRFHSDFYAVSHGELYKVTEENDNPNFPEVKFKYVNPSFDTLNLFKPEIKL